MKILRYKLVLFLIFKGVILQAQKDKKNYREEFTVTPNVVIDVNTRHSDIEIETWNKNKVVIEAFMMVDGEEISEDMKDDFYKKWNFKVTGNKNEINITSRSKSNIDIYSFNFDTPDYSFLSNSLSDFSLGSLDVLDSLDFIMPPLPPLPPTPPLPPMPLIVNLPSEFNFDAYKKDKNYLERWKKENKDVLGKNAKVKIGKNSISITSNDSNFTMSELKQKEQEYSELKKIKEEMKKERKKMLKQRSEIRKNLLKERKKEWHMHRKEWNNKRKEILSLLKKRSKLKIKRFIRIKAPKNAKFNMNVKYGALSFSKE